MRRIVSLVALVAVAAAVAPARADQLAVERMRRDVDALVAIGARLVDSDAAQRALDLLANELTELGVTPERHLYPPGVAWFDDHKFPERYVELEPIRVGSWEIRAGSQLGMTDPNLIARFGPAPSPERPAIAIMAHYDTVPGSPGAVDNAVACAILLETARELARRPPELPVMLVWTAGEEVGLLGAEILAEDYGDEIGVAVSLDLVGAGGPTTLNGLGPAIDLPWLQLLDRLGDHAGIDLEAPVANRVVSRHLPQIERSDHGAFARRGIPALHVYNRGPGGVFLAYHTALDDAGAVRWRSVADAQAFVAALVRVEALPAGGGGDHGWWLDLPGGARVVVSQWILYAFIVVLAGAGLAGLALMWLRRQRERGPGLVLVAPLYLAAWAGAFAVEWVSGRIASHPRPWVHAPGRFVVCEIAVAAALAVIAFLGLRRWRPIAGGDRYLAAAIAACLAPAIALWAVGAPELAWLGAWPAACFAGVAAARRGWLVAGAAVASLLPLAGALSTEHLREAVFHGFAPPAIPLALYLGIVLAPHALLAVHIGCRLGPRVTPRTVILAGAAATAIVIAAVLAATLPAPPCSGAEVRAAGLTCEVL